MIISQCREGTFFESQVILLCHEVTQALWGKEGTEWESAGLLLSNSYKTLSYC